MVSRNRVFPERLRAGTVSLEILAQSLIILKHATNAKQRAAPEATQYDRIIVSPPRGPSSQPKVKRFRLLLSAAALSQWLSSGPVHAGPCSAGIFWLIIGYFGASSMLICVHSA